ncbi:hypothetical protein LNK15_03325 [Jeotgalicoccus huakuii]|nr:hypothetical protein [Jeotgalicoccus huakuii]
MYYNVKGYHGTKTSIANEVYKNGFTYTKYNIYESKKERLPNDLGFGTYFFVDNDNIVSKGYDNAKRYALKYKRKENTDAVSIIVADLTFNENHFLDLDFADNNAYYLQIQRENENLAYEIWSQSKNDGHKNRKIYDGIFIEMMIADLEEKMGITIQGVKKDTFTSFENASRSNFYNGTEISVRDHNCINVNRVSNL